MTMEKQTIIWTALPHGSDGPVIEGNTLHLSVFIAPRLWSDDPNVKKMKLSQFPDFLDWPALIQQATFQVEFVGGPTLAAVPGNVDLRSHLWQALFKSDTDVIPFVFEDLTGTPVQTFSADTLHGIIKGIYQRVAIDDAYGAGRDLPDNGVLINDPDIIDIARDVEPEPPYVPSDPDLGPVVLDEPTGDDDDGDGGGDGDGKGCSGCMGCLLWPLALLRLLFKWLGFSTLAMGMPDDSEPVNVPLAAAANLNAPPPSANTAFNQFNEYMQPYNTVSADLPTIQDMAEIYDFHKMIAALGDYPKMMRFMGLVVDLTVTLETTLPPTTGTIRVIPSLTLQMATTNYSSWTHYELGDGRFLTQPRPTDPDISNGLLRFQDASRFQVIQVDLAGSAAKLQNTATNLCGLDTLNETPANSEDESGLPAMQTAGIAIIKPEKAQAVQASFANAVALNLALAVVDQSPVPSPQNAPPPPPPSDELYAEDVVRGYRIDVFDDKSNVWHSLCQRVGDYFFAESPNGPETVQNLEDEGFVQMGATEPLPGTAARKLRILDFLFNWDGWSLAAPRPGQTILPDHTTGDATNPAVTPFKMEANFRAKMGTLPRLRFGYNYRLRARVADLAGNSVFTPDDPVFVNDVVEQTAVFPFGRFEPVSPPPLMLRAEPVEGESLERLVVRSKVGDAANTITPTERHLVPPKTSQLMSERHGHFDGTPGINKDQAAYDLASREAGSMTHKLNLTTGDLELIDGIQEVSTPEHTIWLQTKEQFELAYLPDPFARGVLLLGLPGMNSFDEIIDPAVQIVNKLPFDGNWPDPKPLRLRLVGLEANGIPAQPNWDAIDRVLTVELAQGETAAVRICSYFDPADLEKMAVWEWIQETGAPNLGDLKAQYGAGRTWLHLPFRNLVLVHAVQQPLLIPQIADPLTPTKTLGETSALLNGHSDIDAKSTSKIDLWAKWEDPFDDLAAAEFYQVPQEMHVAEIIAHDPANDQLPIQAIRHALGDTKYHSVTYTPIATTRFREYFPLAITSDPQNLVRPFPSEAPIPKTIDIPNSARPDAAKPLYVLPTFQWEEQAGGGTITRTRWGNGLRVYLERPWFLSGAGELLGVVISPAVIDPESDVGIALQKYTTRWGMDPLWHAAATEPVTPDRFVGPALTELPGDFRSLAELDNVDVLVAGYQPGYDKDRQLWYADIEIDPGRAYFPFVRLALARYQPISVDGAHLSPVVLADFIQVVPQRTVTYDLNSLATETLPIEVNGPSAIKYERPTLMLASLEVRDGRVPDPEDDLGWQEISGSRVFLQAIPGQPVDDMVWQGVLKLPNPLPNPLRVVVKEYEQFQADRQPTVELPEERDRGPNEDRSDQRLRLVFADAIVIT
jgi:hypothetical protein